MKKGFAQLGIISRGFIFTLMGILTSMTAITGYQGKISGTQEAFSHISTTIFGKMTLLLLMVGMIVYIIWRISLSKKANSKASKWDRFRLQANHLGIAVIYLVFVAYAFHLVFDIGSGSYHDLYRDYLDKWWFETIVLGIGIGVIGKGIFQFYLAFWRKFLILIEDGIPKWVRKFYILFGFLGYFTRGIIYTFLGYLIFRSAYARDNDPSKGPADAMGVLQTHFGSNFLLLLGIGLFIFSLFVYIKARYRKMDE